MRSKLLQHAVHGPDHRLRPRHVVTLPRGMCNGPTGSNTAMCLEGDLGRQPGFGFILSQREYVGRFTSSGADGSGMYNLYFQSHRNTWRATDTSLGFIQPAQKLHKQVEEDGKIRTGLSGVCLIGNKAGLSLRVRTPQLFRFVV